VLTDIRALADHFLMALPNINREHGAHIATEGFGDVGSVVGRVLWLRRGRFGDPARVQGKRESA